MAWIAGQSQLDYDGEDADVVIVVVVGPRSPVAQQAAAEAAAEVVHGWPLQPP